MSSLKKYGWNSSWDRCFNEYTDQGLQPARICAEHKNKYRLFSDCGELWGEITGKYRYTASGKSDYPAVGDWVAAAIPANSDLAVIHAVLPRKSSFGRKIAGNTVKELAIHCRFTDCSHTGEPGCAVVQALKEGALSRDRMESYRKLQKEAAHTDAKRNERLRLEQKKKMKQLAVLQKSFKKGGH
jgi:putative ribosome biogenesis GTPase RsgA